MLTALIIGDPHFKYSNVRETVAMSAKIHEIAMEKSPDFIVCLGDVLDRHETIHVAPLENATRFLNGLRKIAPLYVLIGNHDRPNNSNFLTTEHPFNSLKEWPNTHIIDSVFIDTIQGHEFMFVPYVPPGRFLDALETRGNLIEILPRITCIFAHQEFRGSKMGAIRSEVGDEWPSIFPYVVTGHIHDHDQLQTNILLTGTPIQHAFGDRADKTISFLTWNFPVPDSEMELTTVIPSVNLGEFHETYSDSRIHEILPRMRPPLCPFEERIDLGLEKKILVHVRTHDLAGYQLPNVSSQVKIVVTGTPAENKAIAKTTAVKALLSAGVKIVYKDVPIQTIPTNNQEEIVSPNGPIRSYRDRIYTAVSDDPELRQIVESIYSRVPNTQK